LTTNAEEPRARATATVAFLLVSLLALAAGYLSLIEPASRTGERHRDAVEAHGAVRTKESQPPSAIGERRPVPAPPASIAPARSGTDFGSASASSSSTPPPPSSAILAAGSASPRLWAPPALCGKGSSKKLSDWVAYLKGFRDKSTPELALLADWHVQPALLERVRLSVSLARTNVRLQTGIDAPPPVVYAHLDPATLREHACLTENAVAFYDGAIHVAVSETQRGEIYRSVLHEYTHHALQGVGIREPIWFQEGVAMRVAAENAARFELAVPGIDVAQMVDGFPHGASRQFAEKFYGQAARMVEFLNRLCRRQGCVRDWVAKLRDGAPPSTFFEATIRELAPDVKEPPLSLWHAYLVDSTKSEEPRAGPRQ